MRGFIRGVEVRSRIMIRYGEGAWRIVHVDSVIVSLVLCVGGRRGRWEVRQMMRTYK